MLVDNYSQRNKYSLGSKRDGGDKDTACEMLMPCLQQLLWLMLESEDLSHYKTCGFSVGLSISACVGGSWEVVIGPLWNNWRGK